MPKLYIYNVGDIVETKTGYIKILKQIKIQKKDCTINGYDYQCNIDGNIGIINEYDLLLKKGCPVCSNRKILVGYNDMWTTNPNLTSKLLNKEDGYKYTEKCGTKVDWVCPICGNIIQNKSIENTNKQGLSCPKCSDGISYPEKIMYNLLKQLNIKFKYQYSPLWCKYELNNKTKYGVYDFYIQESNLIVETDGGWHYEDNNLTDNTLENVLDIDRIKDKIAKEHGIEIVRIDCKKSEFEYIKNNTISSKLNNIFNLLDIDWLNINKHSQKSIIYEICKYKNKHSNMTTKEISEIFNINSHTVWKYLKLGNEFKWCNYNISKERKNVGIKNGRKIICLTNGIIYNSCKKASDIYRINVSGIINCCRHRQRYSGKSKNGVSLGWMYLSEYLGE